MNRSFLICNYTRDFMKLYKPESILMQADIRVTLSLQQHKKD